MSDPQYPPLPGDSPNPGEDDQWRRTEYTLEGGGYPDASQAPPPPPPQQGPYGPQQPYGPPPPQGAPPHGAFAPVPSVPQWTASPTTNRAPAVVAIVAVVVLLLGVGVWALVEYLPSSGSEETPTVADEPRAELQDGGFVIGGGDTVVDVYLDFGCPACTNFHATYGERLMAATQAYTITVVYHPIGMLDARNDGYSSRAAAASACAADEYAFESYATVLFANQPPEGSGLSDAEMAALGTDLGLSASFDDCVEGGGYLQWAEDTTTVALESGIVGTPTVKVDGTELDDLTRLDSVLSEHGH